MEIWDVYNEDRIKTGKTKERGSTPVKGDCRLVVHACIFNSSGKMLIQQRQTFKATWSNMWDVSAGGCSISGENSQTTIQRELREELGIDIDFQGVLPNLSVNFLYGFDDIYLFEKDLDLNELKLQYEEVQAVKWATADEIIQMIDDGSFIAYHKNIIRLFFDMRNKYGSYTL